jgi:hypothetical protein
MGIYAQANIQVECNDSETVKIVKDKILNLEKEKDGNENYSVSGVDCDQFNVYLFKTSNRVQNLEYQCELLWGEIKNIKGVVCMHCPFMVEDNGCYFENDDSDENNDIKNNKEIDLKEI